MLKVMIYERKCKSCGLCIEACPKKIIARKSIINNLGYHPVEVTDQKNCTLCTLCAVACPDLAVEVREE